MKNLRLVRLGVGALIVLAMTGCTSDKPAPLMVLDPPPNTVTQVQTFLTEGNRLFREGRWEGARQQFQAAVQEQPDLAEAHYNLALAMDHLGDRDGAKPHFIKAANLAPGNKVIWNSPPLRRYGDVPDKPYDPTTTPVLPGVGGGVGGVGGGGPGGGF
jgi:Tfp pilus assembly protein PilF